MDMESRPAVSATLVAVIVVAVIIGGVGGYFLYGVPTTAQTTLRVFAAASLTYALQNISSSFEKNYSAILTLNLGGSNALAQQILLGSPADVFISANIAQMRVAQNRSLLSNGNTYKALAYNYLAVYVAAANPKHITSLADLVKPGMRVVAEDKSVPAGAYTLEVWKNVQSKWGNQTSPDFKSVVYANYSSRIQQNVVSYATDVESGIAQILTGAADAGFAYVSDAEPHAAQLSFISIPSDVNVKATYAIAVIRNSQQQALANQFVNFLLSPAGQDVLARWGFTPVNSTKTGA